MYLLLKVVIFHCHVGFPEFTKELHCMKITWHLNTNQVDCMDRFPGSPQWWCTKPLHTQIGAGIGDKGHPTFWWRESLKIGIPKPLRNLGWWSFHTTGKQWEFRPHHISNFAFQTYVWSNPPPLPRMQSSQMKVVFKGIPKPCSSAFWERVLFLLWVSRIPVTNEGWVQGSPTKKGS